MSSHLIRSDLVPILSGYIILMAILAIGLRLVRRQPPGASLSRLPAARRRGWLAMLGHAARDIAGGYLLLIGIDLLYYYGVAKVAGNFLESAVTGSALLIGISVPVFLLASWLTQRRRTSAAQAGPPADGDAPKVNEGD